MDPQDWNGFSAFNGTLTGLMLRRIRNEAGAWDVMCSIRCCSDWIEEVRRDPEGHDIPSHLVGTVKRLLDTFFPWSEKHGRIVPNRIFTWFDDGEEKLRGVLLHVNPAGEHVSEIVDAPDALTYIFGVVNSPSDATFNGYYLPLFVLFFGYTYLLFALPSESNPTGAKNVPAVGCLMFTVDPEVAGKGLFWFGHTWSQTPTETFVGPATVTENQAKLITADCSRCMRESLRRLQNLDLDVEVPEPERLKGRCAETQCLIFAQPHYYTELMPPKQKLHLIHGAALETRKLGQAIFKDGIFDKVFNSTNMDLPSSHDSVYRYPCANCKSNITLFHLRKNGQLKEYDKEMKKIRMSNLPRYKECT